MNTLIYAPDILAYLVDVYFDTTKKEKGIPTVAGLALCTGFDSTRQLSNFFENAHKAEDKVNDIRLSSDHTKSVSILSRALTRIEDYYVKNGLENKFPAAMVRFTLAVYHNLSDAPAKADHIGTQNNQYVISFEAKEEFRGVLPEPVRVKDGRVTTNAKALPTNMLVENNEITIEI